MMRDRAVNGGGKRARHCIKFANRFSICRVFFSARQIDFRAKIALLWQFDAFWAGMSMKDVKELEQM